MTVRKITPLPGMVGRVAGFHPYDAPEGWPNGTAVQVVSEICDNVVRIRDAEGREIALPHWCVNTGWEYEVEQGEWLYESHPRVLDALADLLARLRAESWAPAVERVRVDAIADTEAKLRFYGIAA